MDKAPVMNSSDWTFIDECTKSVEENCCEKYPGETDRVAEVLKRIGSKCLSSGTTLARMGSK